MYIEELKEEDPGNKETVSISSFYGSKIGLLDAKRMVVGAGARILFYPTLLYNVFRNKVESEFHWWDKVDEHVLLGAVPFPSDVPRLKHLGVNGVITLNESYETLVPSSLYSGYGIEHLVIPTRDYLFAPSFGDICQAVDFIHKNASNGKTTYVHCKAGRGRSTTIVLCYLVQHKQLSPRAAYEYVRLSRPRVLLAASQWKAVQEYYCLRVKKTGRSICLDNPVAKAPAFVTTRNLLAFDDSSFVIVTGSDLDGYDGTVSLGNINNSLWAELRLVYRVQYAGHHAIARLSWLWIRTRQDQVLADTHGADSCSLVADDLGGGHPCLLRSVPVNL